MECNYENIIGIYIVPYSIGNLFSFRHEGAKQAVPDDEYIGIVMIDVFFILAMVNTMVGWRDKNPFKDTQFINVFCVRPETINGSKGAHSQNHHWVETKNG